MLGSYAQYAFKILIKKLNVIEYIKSNIKNMEEPRTNNPTILYILESIIMGFT